MIRILIADDHPILRQGIVKILSGAPEFIVVGEAQNAKEVIEFIRKDTCDIIILDITMPDRNGLDVLEQIKRERPDTGVLILSVHKEDIYARQAFKSGASGYMTKESAPDELINAVRIISSGRKYVSSAFAEKLLFDTEQKSDERPLHERLSNRELQIMLMIARGETPKSIAEKLFISVKTVNTYRDRILDRMAMKTNADITRYAVLNKLIE